MTCISHIVANGCSFTHGAGLDLPYEQAWPAQLAKKLGVPCVNIARSGSGNDRILRRTYEYFYEDIANQNHPLYVIGFSGITRKDKWFKNSQCYEIIEAGNRNDYASMDYIENYDLVRFYREYLTSYLSLKNLFEAHGVPYIFYLTLDVLNENPQEKNFIHDQVKQILPNQYNLVNSDLHYAGDASIYTARYPTLPCGHWGIEGNQALANHAYTKITDLYKDIKIISNVNYLTNTEYMKKLENYYYNYYNDLHT